MTFRGISVRDTERATLEAQYLRIVSSLGSSIIIRMAPLANGENLTTVAKAEADRIPYAHIRQAAIDEVNCQLASSKWAGLNKDHF